MVSEDVERAKRFVVKLEGKIPSYDDAKHWINGITEYAPDIEVKNVSIRRDGNKDIMIAELEFNDVDIHSCSAPLGGFGFDYEQTASGIKSRLNGYMVELRMEPFHLTGIKVSNV